MIVYTYVYVYRSVNTQLYNVIIITVCMEYPGIVL